MNEDKLKELYLEHLGEIVTHFNGKERPRVRYLKQYADTPLRRVCGRKDVPTYDNSRTWFWGDQHFGHANVITYSDRPFADKHEMTEQLIEAYNMTVGEDDVIYFLGDIAFMGATAANEILHQMHGYKILITGNHDYNKKKLKKYHVDRYSLCETLTVDGIEFALTHYPMDNLPDNMFNIHGHTHTDNTGNPQHINVSVEQIDYRPINLVSILEKIK